MPASHARPALVASSPMRNHALISSGYATYLVQPSPRALERRPAMPEPPRALRAKLQRRPTIPESWAGDLATDQAIRVTPANARRGGWQSSWTERVGAAIPEGEPPFRRIAHSVIIPAKFARMTCGAAGPSHGVGAQQSQRSIPLGRSDDHRLYNSQPASLRSCAARTTRTPDN